MDRHLPKFRSRYKGQRTGNHQSVSIVLTDNFLILILVIYSIKEYVTEFWKINYLGAFDT